MHTKFWSVNLKGRDHSETWPRRDYNIRKDLREVGWEVVYCIHVAQDRDQWRGPVNTVMSIGVP